MQIAELHEITVHQPQMAHSRPAEISRDNGAQRAQADNSYRSLAQLFLATNANGPEEYLFGIATIDFWSSRNAHEITPTLSNRSA